MFSKFSPIVIGYSKLSSELACGYFHDRAQAHELLGGNSSTLSCEFIFENFYKKRHRMKLELCVILRMSNVSCIAVLQMTIESVLLSAILQMSIV